MVERAQAGALRLLLDAGVLSVDPTPWLLASDEPYAVLNTLLGVLGRPPDHSRVLGAREQLTEDDRVRSLIEELPESSGDLFSGHHSPQFLPNRLNLLADLGMRGGDEPRVEELLDDMLLHQNTESRFQSFERLRGADGAGDWHALLCDTNAITDVMLRFGRGRDERVRAAVARVLIDAAPTPQGRAWQCMPDADASGFRGPGRTADVCPQVTLEGLRVVSQLSDSERPEWVLSAARTPLEVWRRRTDERPYAFGHGYQFKSVKWPNFWYDVLWVLETIGRFPELWTGPLARENDRIAIAEMAACLVAYNFDAEARAIPRRTYKGFERFSFGQKKEPSPFATARALIALVRFSDLAEEIASVDVLSLPSSKRGSFAAVPPRTVAEAAPCPLPITSAYPAERALQRVLVRQHLDVAWEPASLESIVADIVALPHTEPASAYLGMNARLRGFTRASLDSALYVRRSLVRYRAMRGQVFVLRRDMFETVQSATARAVVRYAQRFAEQQGVSPEIYERIAPRVLEELHVEPLTTRELSSRIDRSGDGRLDVGAVVTLMAAEGLLLRDRPRGGWLDRQPTWVPLADVLPEVRLNAIDELEARRRLLVAYVRGFGPVTLRDAAWWTGRAPEHARRAVERLEDEIVEVRIEGSEETYLMHAADMDELERAAVLASPAVSILPAYDALTMGYADRSRLLDDEARPYVFDRNNNATSVVLVDGRVRGVWDFTDRPGPTVLVHLFDEVSSRARTRIEEKAAAVGVFIFDSEIDVRFVATMRELADRPAAAVSRPLRRTQVG